MVSFLVKWEDQEVKFNLNSEEFNFVDFDAWIRSRFGVAIQDRLKYIDDNRDGAGDCLLLLFVASCYESIFLSEIEVLPDKYYIKSNKSIRVNRVANKNAGGSVSSSSIKPFDLKLFYMTAPLLVAMACIPSNTFLASIVPVNKLCEYLDSYMLGLGVIQKAGVSLEACIAFVCWATTYLFVRRLLNPETTHEAMQRFSADSFYGGLAAAAAVFLKTFLLARVNGH